MSDTAQSQQTELEKLLRKGKPWLEENGTTLIYLLAGVLAIAAVVVYMNRQPEGNLEPSQELQTAESPEDFQNVADAYPETNIGIWARLQEADRHPVWQSCRQECRSQQQSRSCRRSE